MPDAVTPKGNGVLDTCAMARTCGPSTSDLLPPMRLPPAPVPWALRPLHALQRRRHGRVLEPTALWTWRPAAMLGFLSLFGLLRRRRSPVPQMLRALASVRVSQLADCAFCVDLNSALLAGEDGQARLGEVSRWRHSAVFSEEERLVLEYAEAMTATPPEVDDALMDRLKARFEPAAIVELSAVIGLQNMSARFNHALGARAHGFCSLPGAD